MNKFLSKGSRTLTVIGTVTVLTLLTMVPYGSRLMDRVASLMDPVQYTANVTMATTPRNGAQVTLRSKPTSSEQLLNLSQSSSEANDDIERNVKNPAAQNFSAVIILTYMRSGSSLTGEIMQQNPDSFYVFEPLFSLYVLYKARDSVYFLNETSLNYGDYNVTDLAVQTLRSWLTCDLQNVYLKGLMFEKFMSYGRKTTEFHQCLKAKYQETKNNDSSLNYCVMKLRDKCLASKYRVIKTIRTKMQHVRKMMVDIPQLKIIHLVRDPRDTMMSQKVRGMCGKGTPDDLAMCSATYCYRLEDDIKTKETDSVFRNRVLSVHYEDLAFRALDVCSEMYNFSGIELSESTKKYVHKLTSDDSKDGCKVCQERWQVGHSRANATTHVDKWRTKMPAGFRILVDILCKESIAFLSYKPSNPFWSI